jgi:pilus assembly protein CpaF
MSLETILPYLKPIAHLITDPGISEIWVNPNGTVFFQRAGAIEEFKADLDYRHVLQAIKTIARTNGKDINESSPLLDCRLPDGSRIAAAIPPATEAPLLTIRKFRPNWYSLAQLVDAGALPHHLAHLLRVAVLNRKNILLSGGTGTGKTTFVKALVDLIPAAERLAVIEDTRELKIDHRNVFRYEARPEVRASNGELLMSPLTIRDFVKASLRNGPHRIIVGEVRGSEAFDLLDAMNTGHTGSISTLHANSAEHALSRLASLAIRADSGIPHHALQCEVGDLMDYSVHVRLVDTRRFVAEVVEVHGFNSVSNRYDVTNVYTA